MRQFLNSAAVLALVATGAPGSSQAGNFGEGFSSPERGSPAEINFRSFTVITGAEVCASSPQPVELRVYPNPLRLDIGDRIHRSNVTRRQSELVIEAYDSAGTFLASVPIIVSTIDIEHVVGSRSDWDYFEAIREGEDNLLVSWMCSESDTDVVETRVRMIVGRGNGTSE